jgi:hypothetical protein
MGKLVCSISLEDLEKVPTWLKIKIAIWLFWVVYIPALPLPLLVHLSILTTLCSFFLLTIFPHHRLTIPAAIGGGISFALLLTGRPNAKPKH